MNYDLENHMVIGDYYPECKGDPEPDTCHFCHDEEYDMREIADGHICSSCERTCTYCEDWMLTEEGVQGPDYVMHKDCHATWLKERDERPE